MKGMGLRRKEREIDVKKRNLAMRAGYGLLEILLAISIIASLIATAYYIYKKVKVSQQISSANSIVRTVVGVVENARANAGNVYPAVSGDISATDPFTYYLGAVKSDMAGINYDCTAGSDTTITITFPVSVTETEDICQAVAANINSSTGWQADCSGVQLEITKANVICE